MAPCKGRSPPSIHRPIWSSPGYLGCAAASGPCAAANEAPFSRCVPHRDQATLLGVVSQAAQRCHVELEPGGSRDVEAHPRHPHRTQDVPVRKGKHAAADGLAQEDDLEGSGIDLRRRFAAWAAIEIELPAGVSGANLFARDAFVLAVIDLAKQRG